MARWCPNGPPEPGKHKALARDAEGLDERFVVCSCPTQWACKDPETVPRGGGINRKPEPKRPGPGGVFVDRL